MKYMMPSKYKNHSNSTMNDGESPHHDSETMKNMPYMERME